jgi:O-antigen ligase
MGIPDKEAKLYWWQQKEIIYSILCSGIAAGLVFTKVYDTLFCIVLVAYWLFFVKKEFSTRRNKSWFVILFCSLYLIMIVSAFYSGNSKAALFKLQQKSAILFFPLVFGLSSAVTPAVWKRTFSVFTWSAFIGCVYCILRGIYLFFKNGTTDQLHGYNIVALKGMSGYLFGLCCLLVLLYLLHHLYEAKTKEAFRKKSAVEIPIALTLIFFIFLLGNRNIIFFMTGVMVFFFFKLFPNILHRLFLVASFFFVLVLAVAFNPTLHRQWKEMIDFSKENTIQLDKDESLGRGWGGKALRLTIWKCSRDVIRQHWLAGVGIGDVQDSLQQAYEKRKFYFASRYNRFNAHNQYIQETLANGVMGLLIFLSCLFLPLYVAVKEKNMLYTLFILCFAFICLTESVLDLHKGVIWYSFFNSLLFFKKL